MNNIAANYLGTFVNTVAPFLAIPFYVGFLGERTWGLVSTIFLIQSILYLSEAGVSQISSIAFSRINLSDKKSLEVIKEYEYVYWLIAVVMGLITIICSSLILTLDFLQKYSKQEFMAISVGASFIFLAQFPGAVYKSLLMNTERQVLYNKISVSFTIFRHGLTIALIYLYPSFYVYLAITFSVTLLETVFRRHMAKRGGYQQAVQITAARLKDLYVKAFRPAIAVMTGMLTTQLDKIFAAVMLTPEEYGRYALASILAQGCITATQPIIQAISPKILRHGTLTVDRSHASNKLLTYLITANLIILFAYWVFGGDAIRLWIKSSATAESVRLYLDVLIWGAVLNSIYYVNSYNLLAENNFRQIFVINLLGLIAAAIVTPIIVRTFGVYWIGLAFLIPNIIAIAVTTISPILKK